MTGIETRKPAGAGGSVANAWMRALASTAPIPQHRNRVFPVVIEELADRRNDAPALLSDRECLTYRALNARANQIARWAIENDLAKGGTVCLFMPNRPEYMAIWLGVTRVGGVVALINTNLTGPSLAHCIKIVKPKHVIVAAELGDVLTTALPHLTGAASIWIHGDGIDAFERHSGEALRQNERRSVSIDDRALYIYTSGTTGLPKAANVSHARIMQWSHWFAGMMDVRVEDRMFDCLPMYHSVGGVLAPGAMLAGGGSLVICDKFSARKFWSDVIRWDCTMLQYIGELCRYLLHTPPSPNDTRHRIRVACGNGLSRDVWEPFQSRFRIPQIFEFYAATEGGVSLFNVEGECGALGRVPPYLRHRFSPTLLQFDVELGEPRRNEQGFCVPCAPGETGEAIGPVGDDPADAGSRFEGYTNAEASERKVLHGVFNPGDAWVRTGDLMRKDARGFFYFVDRIGDTFRWKGENVAASEVSETICAFPGVKEASVYGVSISGADGKAGMAALVTEYELDLKKLREHLITRLPHYARPLFLRILKEMEVTGTFKHTKTNLMREGYDPSATADALYFNHLQNDAFVPLDEELYGRIQTGQVRL
jgi:fatty-acyl-CoA synthase